MQFLIYLSILGVFSFLLSKKRYFMIFISFFDKQPNLRNRILTNLKAGIGDKKLLVEMYGFEI